MKKKILAGLLITCCLFAVVGCGSGGESATPTAKTPIQILNDSTAERFESVWTNLQTKATNADLTLLANRVGTLEGQTAPDLADYTTNDTELSGRLTALESLNISSILTNIQAEIAFLKLQSPTVTPTPTPTPTPVCVVTKPANPFPADGILNISENNIELRWSDCGAVNYLLYVGINSSTTLTQIANITVPRYYYNGLLPNTYYCWKVIAVAPLGCPDGTSTWSFRTSP